ncbi:death-inducer obliterator 1 [Rhinophrynus dorsalis]
MEEVPSSQSSVVFDSETNLENMESSSPASLFDDRDQICEDPLINIKPTSKEFKKTWGFRKTTIAKREFASDADMEGTESSQQATPSLRRSGRQPKRTERVEEFLTTVRRNRGRKSATLEDSSDRSCPVTDAETASEGSVESTPDIKTEILNMDPRVKLEVMCKTETKKEEDDSSDSDGMTLKEIQNRLRSRRSDNTVREMIHAQGGLTPKNEPQNTSECSVRTRSSNRAASQIRVKQEPQSPARSEDQKNKEMEVSPKGRPEGESYDPNALYCICRQRHNNRFMICCDRCEEWFHGDCVGIPEARGRLLERNGEDYICPNCTILQMQDESATDSDQREEAPPNTNSNELPSIGTAEQLLDSPGIKGRIEKAAHPNGKKKLKIFHPVVTDSSEVLRSIELPESPAPTKSFEVPVSPAVLRPLDFPGSPALSPTTAVSRPPAVFGSPETLKSNDVADCIGPGCSNLALPDSVYCGHDCILKHAAAAMKSLSAGKETKPKEKTKVKTEKRSPPKIQPAAKPPAVQNMPEKREPLMKKVLIMIPRMEKEMDSELKKESSAPSWESDHNYIAVKPEKAAAISSTLFYKSEKEGIEKKAEVPSPVKKSPPSPLSSMVMKPISSLPRIPMLKKVTPSLVPVKQSAKPVPTNSKNPGPSKSSQPSTSAITKLSPIPKKAHPMSTSAESGQKKSGSSNVSSSHKKQLVATSSNTSSSSVSPPKSKTAPSSSKSAPSSSQSASAPSTSKSTPSSSQSASAPSTSKSAPSSSPSASAPSTSKSTPNVQIRQNIRRSLKEILWKRVTDSDDLEMTENEVAKTAVNIEKEMFSLFRDTDNRYKSKYRNIMFNLKDPKNQGLFRRVLREDLSLAKLVRLKPEELASRKLSSWKESITHLSSALKAKGRTEALMRQTVDMEESPPMSDTDTEQQEPARVAVPERSSAAALPDIFSSMLNDTTSQHRAHLFDLKCKICTGQISADDEPPNKRQKSSSAAAKKSEPQTKLESSEPTTAADPSPSASEMELETPMETSDNTENVPEATPDRPPSASPNNPEPPLSSQSPVYPATSLMTTVTVSGRDPRRAVSRPLTTLSSVPDVNPKTVCDKEEGSTEAPPPPPPPPPPPVFTAPKSILSKPLPSTDTRYLTSSSNINMSDIRLPKDGDTSIFLSRQSPIWKGFINMQTVAKFVTKAYPVSGSVEYLNEDLPDTIHIGGRILPKTVWDYVGKLKSSLSKELSLIRFHPATEEEEVAYISLYSYFSSRARFGVVANNNRHIKDLYLIPLSAKDPIPAKLLPFEGPGKRLRCTRKKVKRF